MKQFLYGFLTCYLFVGILLGSSMYLNKVDNSKYFFSDSFKSTVLWPAAVYVAWSFGFKSTFLDKTK